MKKYLSALLIILSACSNSTNNDLNKRLFTYVKETLKSIDSTHVLDSVKILKMDTITKSQLLFYKARLVYDEINENSEQASLILDKEKTNVKIARLYSGLSKTLSDHYFDEARDNLQDALKIKEKDSILLIQADSLTSLAKISDSTSLFYYEVKCLIQYHKKNLAVKRDTTMVYMLPNKNIIERKDL